ncbi:hypothetical protein LGH83_16320 [Lichenihabitans sp. PAMC28606]|uniref:hypothetical protein n=1 Tax=Lichenihabitans sp. PAMC28606 TaxID=2880932 RepID=UPI001D0AA591|nr:hypothetical protein [Lichenihabitans sp. PAMC28606]UDL94083.1 hypothetical protein LGH83_16320 [Lichenihabitans sp. PAMC28606]
MSAGRKPRRREPKPASLLNLPQSVIQRIAALCEVAAPRSMLSDLNDQFRRSGLREAVARHDTPVLFDWLIGVLSYQGVSDAIAWAYMDQHGTVTYADIDAVLSDQPSCPKLRRYWHFYECRFAKQTFVCREPVHRCASLLSGEPGWLSQADPEGHLAVLHRGRARHLQR